MKVRKCRKTPGEGITWFQTDRFISHPYYRIVKTLIQYVEDGTHEIEGERKSLVNEVPSGRRYSAHQNTSTDVLFLDVGGRLSVHSLELSYKTSGTT